MSKSWERSLLTTTLRPNCHKTLTFLSHIAVPSSSFLPQNCNQNCVSENGLDQSDICMKLWETKILALKKKLTTNSTKNPTIWEMCKSCLWETELLKLKQSVMQYESVWQKVLSKVVFMNTLHQTVSIEIQKPSPCLRGSGYGEMSEWPHCHEDALHVTSRVSWHNDTGGLMSWHL